MARYITRNKMIWIEILIIMATCLLFQTMIFGQNVGINNTNPHAKSMLDITSTDKGLLIPRLSESARLAMFPVADLSAKGMIVYQTDVVEGFYYYNGTAWQHLAAEKRNWEVDGNTGTNPNIDFIGTTDNTDLTFRTNNSEHMRLTGSGKLGLGTSNPEFPFASSRFSIADEDGANSDISLRVGGNWSTFPALYFSKHRGTLASPTMNGLGDLTGQIAGYGYDGSSFRFGSSISFGVDSAVTNGYVPGHIIFSTSSAINNGEKMRINRNGYVGVGTNNPTYGVHIVKHMNTAPLGIRNLNDNAIGGIHYFGSAGSLGGVTGWSNNNNAYAPGSLVHGTLSNMPATFITNTIERMRITADGKVGIGTNNPLWKLDVQDVYSVARLTTTNNTYGAVLELNNLTSGSQTFLGAINFNDYTNTFPGQLGYQPVNGMSFKTGGTEKMWLLPNGNLGLGINTPVTSVDVEKTLAQMRLTSTNSSLGAGIVLKNTTAGQPFLGSYSFTDETSAIFPAAISYHTGTGMMFKTGGNERMYISPSGKVGIGTSSPSYQLQVLHSDALASMQIQNTNPTGWSGIHLDNHNATGRTHLGFGNNFAIGYTNLGYTGTTTNHAFVLTTANQERIRITAAGDVGIKTTTPGADFEVNGFTKLGNNAPAIKMLKLTSTTASSQGGSVNIAHGLNGAKILSVDVVVESFPGTFIKPGFLFTANLHFNILYTSTLVSICNVAGNSANILSKPIKILITYEE